MQILSANALKPSPKPVASNPSTPKPVTPVPMPYVPAVDTIACAYGGCRGG